MKKLVITGGPQAGKSTIIRVIKKEFGNRVALVSEASTAILEGGFPIPNQDVPWSQELQDTLQSAILPLQIAMEKGEKIRAKHLGAEILICDRGILDGAAYTSGGVAEFCRKYNLNLPDVLNRYDTILHLESVAVSNPEEHGNTSNRVRFEPLKVAQDLELRTLSAWEDHPRQLIFKGRKGFEGKIREVISEVRRILCD